MHKGIKHTKVMEGYNDFARSEGAEAKKYVDSVRTNDPFAKGVDDMMDEESRRRERGFYVKGTTISKEKGIVDTKDDGPSRVKSPLNKLGLYNGLSRCWSDYKPNPDGRPASEKGSCVKK